MATNRKNISKSGNEKGTSNSSRQAPGNRGQGDYFHVEVRPGEDFVSYRTQDVGDPGHIQRVGGKRASGSWATVKWLISKEDAHLEGDTLVADTRDAQILLEKLGPRVTHKSGDRFEAKQRRNASTRAKPTAGPKKVQPGNSK